jgi:tripartite-type tricarboxylate transporter receptor subunit TctC
MNRLVHSLVAVTLAVAAAIASAQDAYPSRPVRIVVGFPPGGVTDVIARILAPELQKEFGQPFVVENKPGAAGIIGAEQVAKSPADGHTLLFIPSTHLVHPALRKEMPYDTVGDFTAITLLVTAPNLFIVRADAPWKDLKEFIAEAKAKPDSIQWASSGIGVSTHLGGELFQHLAGIKLYHVPYKSSTQPVEAVIAGQVRAAVSALNAALPHIKSGRIRALAVATEKRSTFLPDIPTFEELGVKDMRSDTWIGVLAPARLPPAIAARLNRFFMAAIARPDMKERIAGLGAEPVGVELEKFAALMRAEVEVNTRIARAANIKPE